MANIVKRPDGHRWVQFFGVDGKRRTLRLGKVDRRTAEEVKAMVESILGCQHAGQSLKPNVSVWLDGVSSELFDKLVRCGLAEADTPPAPQLTVGQLVDNYIARRHDVKPRTRLNYLAAGKSLQGYFGSDCEVASITSGHAGDWRRDERRHYAEATVSKWVKIAKQFCNDAIDREQLASNPFRKLEAKAQVNESRLEYVPAADVEKVISSCNSPEWRVILSLCRFAGLRCPSEVLRLTWEDVLWGEKKLVVRSTKTEHHRDKGIRMVPLFPQVAPHLRALFETAGENQPHVITQYRGGNANLRTQLIRLCKRAGVTPWGKLFQNMRASAETDLAKQFGTWVAAKWIGNSEAVAQKHYLSVSDADFAAAAVVRPET